MTELAYMVREDWAQEGTGMASHSTVIRKWLGDEKFLLLVTDATSYGTQRSADREAVEYIGAADRRVGPITISDLPRLRDKGVANVVALAIHPYVLSDLEALKRAIDDETLGRLFVMVWAPHEVVRVWLESLGAVNIYAGTTPPPSDPVMLAAGRMMVNEEYNGLSSGIGKDTVVGLIRAFLAAGYPSDADSWARAYLAAGGSFRDLASVTKFAKEIDEGTRHRVRPRFREGIVGILRERVASA
jgi:hypothetical protein